MVNYSLAITILVNQTSDDDANEWEDWEEFMTIIGDEEDDLFSIDYETYKQNKK